MQCDGLAAKWEQDHVIRRRLLSANKLMQHPTTETWCQPNRENAKANASVILPALEMLSGVDSYHLPHLRFLEDELGKLYSAMRQTPGGKVIYKAAIEIKKMLGFIKRRVNHREVTKVRGSKTCVTQKVKWNLYYILRRGLIILSLNDFLGSVKWSLYLYSPFLSS